MDRDIRVLSLAALATAILTPTLAAAQAPPQGQATGRAQDRAARSQGLRRKTARPSGRAAKSTRRKPADKNLSDKLARTRAA